MLIRKLDAVTSEQIAAGEVVENPSSVVKELVENALDAGAKRIKVVLKKGGLQEITVVDNGTGIPKDELRLALERHATSKIKTIKDLEKISSLGFRGEALPSIASVSKMSITTRHQDEETGAYIFLEGNKEKNFYEIGFPTGTRVTVADLFYNTPARLKFLKGIPAETARISKTLGLIALSRPDVSFSLTKESGVLLETPGDGNLFNAIINIYGNNLARELVPLNFQNEELNLSGFISNPSFSRNSRNFQVFFVNKRYVRSQIMKDALDKGYAGIVTSRRYPAAILLLTISPENLDVNVHPAKTEIRFHQEKKVKEFLEQSIKKAFSPGYYLQKVKQLQQTSDKDISNSSYYKEDNKVQQQLTEKESHLPKKYLYGEPNVGIVKEDNFSQTSIEKPLHKKANLTAKLFTGSQFSNPIGQIFATYILLEEGDNLVLLDQHAAHERILWEKFIQKEEENEQYVQEIIPFNLDVPAFVTEGLKGKIGLLKEIGLEMEHFGNNTFTVRSVPFFLKDTFTVEVILDILENLSGLTSTGREFKKETLLTLSCKAAIKANKALTLEEIKSLLEQLEKCKNPFLCPHGRPVMVKIDKREIEKYFKRQG